MSRRAGALIVLVIALAAHGAYLGVRGPAVQADGAEYRRLAENLRQHSSFSLDEAPPYGPSIRRGPGFPFFIALTGSSTATIVMQVLLSAGVATLVFLLASTMVPLGVALAAGLLYAVHPGSLYWARMLHSEATFTFFTTLGVWLLVRGQAADARRPFGWLAGGGASLGWAALCRPAGAPFILVAALLIFLRNRDWRKGACVLALGLAVIAPWVIRSSLLAHRFVLLSATSTANLYIGAQSGQPIYDDVWFQRFLREDPCGHGFNSARTPAESVQADDLCGAGARAAIQAHPAAYLTGRGRALLRMLTSSFDLTLDNQLSTGELRARGKWALLFLKVLLFFGFCVLPVLLALFGLTRAWSAPAGAMTAALWLYTLAVHVPGYTEFRYFVPAVPALFVTGAVGLWRILD